MDKCSYNPNQAQNQGHDANRTSGQPSRREQEQRSGTSGTQRDRQTDRQSDQSNIKKNK